ncbi:MAG: prepilin peptidase [bacterium]|nr:prepilin peptidase [bacterium]MDT8365604.1 prepilin peptidase [bacterium]
MSIQFQIVIFAFPFGAIMGSFANVLIHRLPMSLSIVSPGSRCPSCGSGIRWSDNIPILSYFILGGRCRICKTTISPRYPLVEALSGLLFAAVGMRFGIPAATVPLALLETVLLVLAATVPLALFVWALVVITFIDLDHRIIPDVISGPGTILGLACSFLPGFPRPMDSVAGVGIGAGFLFLVLYAYEKIMGEEGMGLGDVKLLAMIGAFLGWQALPVTILVSSLSGSVVGVGYALVKGESVRKFPVPFGPFLALGALVHLFFGVQLIQWYLGKLS